MESWISQHVPRYAVAALGDEWMAARVSQHRVRVRFPQAVPGKGHARLRGKNGDASEVRQGVAPRSRDARQESGR
jgi:hypothetical protein